MSDKAKALLLGAGLCCCVCGEHEGQIKRDEGSFCISCHVRRFGNTTCVLEQDKTWGRIVTISVAEPVPEQPEIRVGDCVRILGGHYGGRLAIARQANSCGIVAAHSRDDVRSHAIEDVELVARGES